MRIIKKETNSNLLYIKKEIDLIIVQITIKL